MMVAQIMSRDEKARAAYDMKKIGKSNVEIAESLNFTDASGITHLLRHGELLILAEENEVLKAQIADEQATNTELEKRYYSVLPTIDKAYEERDKLKEQLSILQQQKDELDKQLTAFSQTNDNDDSNLDKLNEELSILREENKKLVNTKSDLDNNLTTSRQEFDRLNEELTTTLKKNGELVKSNLMLDKQLTSAAQQLDDESEELKKLSNEVLELRQYKIDSISEKAALDNELTTARQDLDKLNAELTTLRKKVGKTYDIGKWLSTNAIVKFLVYMVILAAAAWVFASLTEKMYEIESASIPFGFAFAIGLAIQFLSVIVASNPIQILPSDGTFDKERKRKSRNAWLIGFAVFQFLVECSFWGIFDDWSTMTWSETIGKLLVAAALPFASWMASSIYFTEKEEIK